jgi:hypothetical protein
MWKVAYCGIQGGISQIKVLGGNLEGKIVGNIKGIKNEDKKKVRKV